MPAAAPTIAATAVASEPVALTLNLPKDVRLQVTPEQFEALAANNRDLRLELTATGELIVNSPTGAGTGARNWSISGELYVWWRGAGQPGQAFDSSPGFRLPNGAILSPDASWASADRWDSLTPEEQEAFAPICPDFVAELRSKSDSLEATQAKMREYVENAARLGWLLDPKTRKVEIYRPDRAVEVLTDPKTLSGEDVLSGFTLELVRIWG
ncbi:MAG: Uma2 family endonuclease [Geitlerinemataceae cyanobacterium]|mgnify:CR=1 FL=1